MEFAIWKEVEIGIFEDSNALMAALLPFDVSPATKRIICGPEFRLSKIKRIVGLCMATVQDLVGENIPIVDRITRAVVRSVGDAFVEDDFCPDEVGPIVRMQHLDQPEGEELYVLVRPLRGPCGASKMFKVERDKGVLKLGTGYANPGYLLRRDDKVVFLANRPK